MWSRDKNGGGGSPMRHTFETDDHVAKSRTCQTRTDGAHSFSPYPVRTIIRTERRLLLSSTSTSTELTSPCNTPEVEDFSSTLARTLSAKRFKQPHQWLSNVVLNLEKCCVCGKRFGFNRTSFKCTECRIVAHPNCKDSASLPCLGLHGSAHAAASNHLMTPDSASAAAGTAAHLVDHCGTERPFIPTLLVQCIAEIERRALGQRGLYRSSSSKKLVKDLHARFIRARTLPQLSAVDINLICGCVKFFLSSLCEPLITFAMWPVFRDAAAEACRHAAVTGLRTLPVHNRDTLAFILLHLQAVAARSAQNEMTLEQLERVFAPILVGNSSSDVQPIEAIDESPTQMAILHQLLSLPSSFYAKFISDASESRVENDAENRDTSPIGSVMLGPVHADHSFQPQMTPVWSKKKFFPEPRLY